MLRVTKIADYGLLILVEMARGEEDASYQARDLAESTRLPLETVRKILKTLARAGLLVSQRGVKGGYVLARPAARIDVAAVIEALDGPIAITDCMDPTGCSCVLHAEGSCTVSSAWGRVNRVLLDTLRRMSLEDIARPPGTHAAARPPRRPAAVAGTSG